MRKIVTVLLLAALTTTLAACGQRPQPIGSQGDPIAPRTVLITNLSFIPQRMVVTAGQAVTWQWEDAITPHNVSFDTLIDASPTQVNGRWSHTFDTPGTYSYRCTIHRNMNGEIVVRPSS